jgi:hypothetical protein
MAGRPSRGAVVADRHGATGLVPALIRQSDRWIHQQDAAATASAEVRPGVSRGDEDDVQLVAQVTTQSA